MKRFFKIIGIDSGGPIALTAIVLTGLLGYALYKCYTFAVIEDSTEAASKPDVLFIAVDDLNDWVGVMGGPIQAQTPNIDALAERGMFFSNAHSVGTSCTPSRTALLTGMSPFNSGLYSHDIDWRESEVLSNAPTLPRFFRDNGYQTLGAGKIFHAHSYHLKGAQGQQDTSAWDAYFPSLKRQLTDEIYPVDQQTEGEARGRGVATGVFDYMPIIATDAAMGDGQVVSWITDRLAESEEGPRFIAAGIYRPHLPWYTPAKYFDLYPIEKIQLPPYLDGDRNDVGTTRDMNLEPHLGYDVMPKLSEADTTAVKEAIQGYLASISFADAMVGELINALDASGRADSTIIILWADHGFHLGEKDIWGKLTLWERSSHVPLIVVAPGVTQIGTRSGEAVSLQSVYATLADLAGLEVPAHVDGTSLRPLLEDPSSSWDEVAFTTVEFGSYAVQDDHFRYIRYLEGGEELYDHRSDPNEWKNLASDPAYAETLAAMRAKLPPPDQQAPPQVLE